MRELRVTAVCLTRDRPEMTLRAIRSFRAQAYAAKSLLVFDTSVDYFKRHWKPESGESYELFGMPSLGGSTIGELRNRANALADGDIIVTWDSDDWSHPNRIAEQVAHLQSSGADVVGYNEILFWRTNVGKVTGFEMSHRGGLLTGLPVSDVQTKATIEMLPAEAWIWKNARGRAGSSFAYWRKTWEQKPFPDQPRPGCVTGEDYSFVQGLNFAAVSGIPPGCEQTPRLVASIHGGNTSNYDLEGMIARGSREWRRAPEFDDYARKVMVI